MRRNVAALLLVLITPAFAAAQSDSAQVAPPPISAQRAWGLGLALTATGGADGTPVGIRVPFRLGRGWRIEPELGFYRSTIKNSTYINDPSSPTPPTHDEGPHFHQLLFAVAITRIIPIDNAVRFYIGPRIGLNRQTAIYDVDGSAGVEHLDISTTDHWFGLLTGAEASFGSRLTLGGEVGLTYVKGGEAHVHQPAYTSVGIQDGGHYFTTTGAIVMRWFPGRIATGASPIY